MRLSRGYVILMWVVNRWDVYAYSDQGWFGARFEAKARVTRDGKETRI